MWTGNYEITGENHAGRSTLSCELDLKTANVGQTHTHKVSTITHWHMRRVLNIPAAII